MTEFISRAYGGKEFEVIIKTDCKEHYKYAELFARKLIDHGKTHTMTNADRIRAMSDEELAEFLILSPEMEFDVCRYCEYGNPTPMDDRGFCLHPYGSCLANAKAEAFKKWLKQPVKDGEGS